MFFVFLGCRLHGAVRYINVACYHSRSWIKTGTPQITLMIIRSEGVSINFSSVSLSFVSCSTGHPWRSVGNEGDVQLQYTTVSDLIWRLITSSRA
jgi:hypothetical protein